MNSINALAVNENRQLIPSNSALIEADDHEQDLSSSSTQSTYDDWYSAAADKSVIDVSDYDMSNHAELTWAALLAKDNPRTLFVFAGKPARLEADQQGGVSIQELNSNRMHYQVVESVAFIRRSRGGGIVDVPPPNGLIRHLLATPNPPLPPLVRIVQAPVFAADGTLQTDPGYHAASRTFFAPRPGFTVPDVPERPTSADLERARQMVCTELLGDFPFVADADRAHTVALMLLPFARDLIDGPTPLHLIEKPTPGTGGTLLAELLAVPATGREVPAMTEGGTESEMRKRITGKLRTGPEFILFDNLRSRLDSAALSSVITAPTWEDRIVGSAKLTGVPNRAAWIATGNNPELSTEIARRAVRIRLDSGRERPFERTGFRHASIREWALENRAGLVWSALAMIRAWLSGGRVLSEAHLGSFEGWSATLGGILEVAGIPGFLGNLAELYAQSDDEGRIWRSFLHAWFARFSGDEVLVSALYGLAVEAGISFGAGSHQAKKVKLGKMLAKQRDRVFDIGQAGAPQTVRIVQAGQSHGACRWKLDRTRV